MSRKVCIIYNITESLYHKTLREGKKLGEVRYTNVVCSDTSKVLEKDLELFNYIPNDEVFYMTLGFKCSNLAKILGTLSSNENLSLNNMLNGITTDFYVKKDCTINHKSVVEETKGCIEFNEFLTFDQALESRKAQLKQLTDKKQWCIIESSKINAEIDEKLEKEKEEKKRFKEERELKEKQFKEDMLNWIEKHGSNRLKLLVKGDYYYESLYATERAFNDISIAEDGVECHVYVDTEDSATHDIEELIPTEEQMLIQNELKEKGFDCDIVKLNAVPENCFENDMKELKKWNFDNSEDEYAIAIENIYGTGLWGYIK